MATTKTWLEQLPRWVLVLLAALLVYLVGLTTYAVVFRNYGVEFWPPKLLPPSSAATGTQATYAFRIESVDDEITCELNGVAIASKRFGPELIERDITAQVRKGDNVLRCRVVDNDNGKSYAYVYELLKNGTQRVFRREFSCSGSPTCVKGTPYVHDEAHHFSD